MDARGWKRSGMQLSMADAGGNRQRGDSRIYLGLAFPVSGAGFAALPMRQA
jgi:hypothetical protein